MPEVRWSSRRCAGDVSVMSVARQLYQLQEIDTDIEDKERRLNQLSSKLGQNREIIQGREKLATAQKRLEDLKHQQNTVDWELEDLTGKINKENERLYSGRIQNPKELSGLQQEVNILKNTRDQVETRVLEMMEQVEGVETEMAAMDEGLRQLEAEWQSEQQRISAEIESLKAELPALQEKREAQAGAFDIQALALYDKLRKQKARAVARVEQGICSGCRISLSFSELQQVRIGGLVQCSSCGRILFLP
jgi:predicted  nucleic acid-binding Zn-ribbon protein